MEKEKDYQEEEELFCVCDDRVDSEEYNFNPNLKYGYCLTCKKTIEY